MKVRSRPSFGKLRRATAASRSSLHSHKYVGVHNPEDVSAPDATRMFTMQRNVGQQKNCEWADILLKWFFVSIVFQKLEQFLPYTAEGMFCDVDHAAVSGFYFSIHTGGPPQSFFLSIY